MLKIIIAQFALVLFLLLLGCDQNNYNAPMKTEARTDILSLSKFIQLPIQPVSAQWQTADIIKSATRAPGPRDWGLIAMLEFNKDDLATLVSKAEQHEGPAQIPASQFHAWLPDRVKDKFKLDEGGQFYSTATAAKDAVAFSL